MTELMVALMVVSVGVAGLMASFTKIQRAIQGGKSKTMASNLAQEQMQIVKQQSYFWVIPTMNPAFLPDGTAYDTGAFPPETIVAGGIAFQRYTYVQVVTENNGVISVLPPTTPDTGMRQITVTVEWPEGGKTKSLAIRSVMANPNTIESNSVFTGAVVDAGTSSPIAGALVNVAENTGWRNTTDGGGNYTIRLSPGSFRLAASARGYFSQYVLLSIGPTNTVTQNFSLTKMSSGSVTGTAWVNPGVLISQIVVSTPQANGYVVEYVELFNPTRSTVTVNGALNFNFNTNHPIGSQGTICQNMPLTYVNGSIPPAGYYVVANTTTFTVNGVAVVADAYYKDSANLSCNPGAYAWNPPSVRDIMAPGRSGTWWLTNGSGGIVDAAGWDKNGSTYNPSNCLGSCYSTNSGLNPGDQLVRASSPAYFSSSYGRAYSSANNSLDFTKTALQYGAFSTASGAQPVIAGVPAAGAVASASDGLSTPVSAALVGSPPVAQFALTQVATGTWTVLVTSGAWQVENDTVTVPATGSVYVYASSMGVLGSAATAGFIAGAVVDGLGNAISVPSPIAVSAAGQSATANAATGAYLLRVSSGSLSVTANPNFANPNYVSVSSLSVPVALGRVTSGVNFVLSQGGRLTGWVTRDGVNGLQGVTVTATDVNGNVQDQETSDVNGNFTTINVATGVYTVGIPLDTAQVSSPTVATVTSLLGQTVSVGTFTISGALGTISGSVTLGGSPLTSGVLVVVATGTVAMPPNISSFTLASAAFYLASSLENGTYSVSVRQSTSPAYNIYGYYPTLSPTGAVTINVRTLTGVPVLAGQTVSGKNLAW